MVACEGARKIEGRRLHPQRIENLLLHRFVVGGPELQLRIHQVCANVSRGRRHQIAVLKDLAKLAGRLHGPEQSEGGFRSCILEFEYPFQILSRHSGARANQVLDENLFRSFRIAKFEARVGLDHRFIPLQFFLVDQFCQEQRRHSLCVGRRHEQRILVHRLRLAQFAHAKPTLIHNFAAINQRHGSARDTEFLHGGFNERFELSDMCSVQRLRFTAGKRLAAGSPSAASFRRSAKSVQCAS